MEQPVTDALNYIGRNIAQQDAMRMRHMHALETIARCLQSIVLLAGVAIIFSAWRSLT